MKTCTPEDPILEYKWAEPTDLDPSAAWSTYAPNQMFAELIFVFDPDGEFLVHDSTRLAPEEGGVDPELEAMFARVAAGKSPTKDKQFAALAKRAVEEYESNPVGMKTWAATLAKSSARLND